MKLDKNITINLTEQDVKEIIAEKCRAEGYTNIKAENVTLEVGQELKGYGLMEHNEIVFKGCKIHYKEE